MNATKMHRVELIYFKREKKLSQCSRHLKQHSFHKEFIEKWINACRWHNTTRKNPLYGPFLWLFDSHLTIGNVFNENFQSNRNLLNTFFSLFDVSVCNSMKKTGSNDQPACDKNKLANQNREIKPFGKSQLKESK